MRNAIVTAADAKYLPAACCALISSVYDGSADPDTGLFLLASEVTSDDVSQARKFLGEHGVSAQIFTIDGKDLGEFKVDGYVSPATYSRLLLREFFDKRWARVVYLDADMRVMQPLRPLFNLNFQRKPIAAVHDYLRYMIYGMHESRSRLCLQSDAPYFNAGLICFDWQATIASGLLAGAQTYAVKCANLCRSHDQDALNKAFEGEWLPLDPCWNLMAVAVPDHILRLDYPPRFRPQIWHFAGSVKPWMSNFPQGFGAHQNWYTGLLRNSPWPDFVAAIGPSQKRERGQLSEIVKGGVRRLRATFRDLRQRRKSNSLLVSGLGLGSCERPLGLERLLDALTAQASGLGKQ